MKVRLVAELQLQQDGAVVGSAKLSLFIEGNWNFTDPVNVLEVEYMLSGSFQDFTTCGELQPYRMTSDTTKNIYYFATDNNAVNLDLLRDCTADNVTRTVLAQQPIVFNNHSAVNITLTFPSFRESLAYDPNFALLLGFTSGSWTPCNALFGWILPVAFIGGAVVVVLVVVVLSYSKHIRPIILGTEGTRIQALRDFVNENQLSPNSDMNVLKQKSANETA